MEEKVLKAMKKAGKPVRPGDVAKMLSVESKEVSKIITGLKKEGKVISPKRCYYSLNDQKQCATYVKNRNKIFVAKLIILTYLLNLSNDCFSTTIYLLPVQCDIGTIKLIFFDDSPQCKPLFQFETFLYELFLLNADLVKWLSS